MSGDEIEVCPECDSARINVNVQTNRYGNSAETKHRCRDCGSQFDEPAMRPVKHQNDTRHGLAAKLSDPDTELMTDGGRDDWYACDACGAEYRNAKAALDCCSDRLDDVDRGEGIVTDGGLKSMNAFADEFWPNDWDDEDIRFLAEFLEDQTYEYELLTAPTDREDLYWRLYKEA